MSLVARLISYALFCCAYLFFGVLAFALGALVGGYGLGVLAVGLRVLGVLTEEAAIWFAGGGAMLGGGWALMRLSIECVEAARESRDPALRRCGERLHELGRAMIGKTPT